MAAPIDGILPARDATRGTVDAGFTHAAGFNPPDQRVRVCGCVGGPNCCIRVAEREREAAIRADERAKVLAEIEQQRSGGH